MFELPSGHLNTRVVISMMIPSCQKCKQGKLSRDTNCCCTGLCSPCFWTPCCSLCPDAVPWLSPATLWLMLGYQLSAPAASLASRLHSQASLVWVISLSTSLRFDFQAQTELLLLLKTVTKHTGKRTRIHMDDFLRSKFPVFCKCLVVPNLSLEETVQLLQPHQLTWHSRASLMLNLVQHWELSIYQLEAHFR